MGVGRELVSLVGGLGVGSSLDKLEYAICRGRPVGPGTLVSSRFVGERWVFLKRSAPSRGASLVLGQM